MPCGGLPGFPKNSRRRSVDGFDIRPGIAPRPAFSQPETALFSPGRDR